MFVLAEKKLVVKPSDPYMDGHQLDFFKTLLTQRRAELYEQINQPLSDRESSSDPIDAASIEEDRKNEAISRNRAQREVVEVNQALERIESGDYGYCEDTGEPIGIERLQANPVARYSIFAQERREKINKTRTVGIYAMN